MVFGECLQFFCQFSDASVASSAAAAPDSAEADLVFHVFEGVSQFGCLQNVITNIAIEYKRFAAVQSSMLKLTFVNR
jgi:hypothetical protein